MSRDCDAHDRFVQILRRTRGGSKALGGGNPRRPYTENVMTTHRFLVSVSLRGEMYREWELPTRDLATASVGALVASWMFRPSDLTFNNPNPPAVTVVERTNVARDAVGGDAFTTTFTVELDAPQIRGT